VGVGLFGEGGRLLWCGFNASVLTREGRRRDEALPKDKVEAAPERGKGGDDAS
jgi:hypothetical protein